MEIAYCVRLFRSLIHEWSFHCNGITVYLSAASADGSKFMRDSTPCRRYRQLINIASGWLTYYRRKTDDVVWEGRKAGKVAAQEDCAVWNIEWKKKETDEIRVLLKRTNERTGLERGRMWEWERMRQAGSIAEVEWENGEIEWSRVGCRWRDAASHRESLQARSTINSVKIRKGSTTETTVSTCNPF